ncbi:uncharacterized protein LOC132308518 isoform X2 [Cornus florida]|uniref:uncharacterized protein LOC132308518 isoform X2 n=1 Tax=Cornus florida TaxID=4283 RepID=UPI00289D40B8|nr:uncharacterized protein LOC132308518 isoform X2 [Cornus florida]
MNLVFQLPNRAKVVLPVGSESIDSIKRVLTKKQAIPFESQVLIYNGFRLEGQRDFASYGLVEEGFCVLVDVVDMRFNECIAVVVEISRQGPVYIPIRDESVLDLKKRIEELSVAPLSSSSQVLFLNDIQLKDDQKLSSYRITHGSVIEVYDLELLADPFEPLSTGSDGLSTQLGIVPAAESAPSTDHERVRVTILIRGEVSPLRLVIGCNESVFELKKKIERSCSSHMPSCSQVLLFEGVVLNDGSTISSYRISEDSYIRASNSAVPPSSAGQISAAQHSVFGSAESTQSANRLDAFLQSNEQSIKHIETMGVRIYRFRERDGARTEFSWDNMGGYADLKREIEFIMLTLQSHEVYDAISRETRNKFERNRPLAVLFEGPPGTGKSLCSSMIANQAVVPVLEVPRGILMPSFNDHSTHLLREVFSLANEHPNGAIILLDGFDAYTVARDSETREATIIIASELSRLIKSIEQDKKVVVIAATNRKQDIVPDILILFDRCISFKLPDNQSRQEIVALFAKHLKEADLVNFAANTEGMSGREIKDLCREIDMDWATKIIQHQGPVVGSLPPLREYLQAIRQRNPNGSEC